MAASVVSAAFAMFAPVSAHAAAIDGGPYFAALQALGANDIQASVQGPQLSWDCAGSACSFSGALRASVVFEAAGSPDAAALDIGALFVAAATAPVALVDPLGHAVGYYQVNVGAWRFESVAANAAAPAGSIFMSAYGHNEVSLSYEGQTYHALELMSGGQASTAGVGPGSAGASTPFGVFSDISARAISPYYAFPSKTDPRCASFSCLEFGAGQFSSTRFALSFDLVAVAAPVPEPGTVWTMLAGLGLAAAVVARRKAG